MKALLSIPELRTWARDDSIADDDAFALKVIEAASLKVAEHAGHVEWLADDYADVIPSRALLIAALVAKRSYLNPDSIVGEGGIGPLGGDRFVEDLVRFLELTDAEKADLEALRPADYVDPGAARGGLYTVATENRPAALVGDTIYVSGSPYAYSDGFPLGSTKDAAAYGL